jgi:hypothetical protein
MTFVEKAKLAIKDTGKSLRDKLSTIIPIKSLYEKELSASGLDVHSDEVFVDETFLDKDRINNYSDRVAQEIGDSISFAISLYNSTKLALWTYNQLQSLIKGGSASKKDKTKFQEIISLLGYLVNVLGVLNENDLTGAFTNGLLLKPVGMLTMHLAL